MVSIVSRQDTEAGRVKQLQDMITTFSRGAIGSIGSGTEHEVADNVDDLLIQVHGVLLGTTIAAEVLHRENKDLAMHSIALEVALSAAQDMLERLVDDIDYDEALDSATTRLMDEFSSSGAANTTADGELEFDERITFSKEDIKPFLRAAVVEWIEARLAT